MALSQNRVNRALSVPCRPNILLPVCGPWSIAGNRWFCRGIPAAKREHETGYPVCRGCTRNCEWGRSFQNHWTPEGVREGEGSGRSRSQETCHCVAHLPVGLTGQSGFSVLATIPHPCVEIVPYFQRQFPFTGRTGLFERPETVCPADLNILDLS